MIEKCNICDCEYDWEKEEGNDVDDWFHYHGYFCGSLELSTKYEDLMESKMRRSK